MATKGADLFVDASYVIALGINADALHHEAVARADWLRRNPDVGLVTTRAVLLEIGNALGRLRFRSAAIAILETIESDPRIQIVPLSDDLYEEALSLFRERTDKEWGITDCISFVVMQRSRPPRSFGGRSPFRAGRISGPAAAKLIVLPTTCTKGRSGRRSGPSCVSSSFPRGQGLSQ